MAVAGLDHQSGNFRLIVLWAQNLWIELFDPNIDTRHHSDINMFAFTLNNKNTL